MNPHLVFQNPKKQGQRANVYNLRVNCSLTPFILSIPLTIYTDASL